MSRLRWLPNAITLLRLAGIPLLVVFVAVADGPTSGLVAWTFGAISATDFLDGLLARRLGAESTFGRILDPLADRLVLAVGLAGLIVLHRLPWAGPAILLARDALSVAAFGWLARRGPAPRVDALGKLSSALAMVAVGLALLLDQTWVDALFWAAVGLAIVSLVNYARKMVVPRPSTSG